jgi:hypothetical protein
MSSSIIRLLKMHIFLEERLYDPAFYRKYIPSSHSQGVKPSLQVQLRKEKKTKLQTDIQAHSQNHQYKETSFFVLSKVNPAQINRSHVSPLRPRLAKEFCSGLLRIIWRGFGENTCVICVS